MEAYPGLVKWRAQGNTTSYVKADNQVFIKDNRYISSTLNIR